MTSLIMRKALHRSLAQIQHVRVVQPGAAQGLVAAVYAQVEKDFGMLAPPVALHSAAAGPLAASWVMLRETLVAKGQADRAAKETVAAAVSLGNSCPYCVAVHNAVLGGLAYGPAAAAIGAGHIESIADPRIRDLALWARASGQPAAAWPAPEPFPAEQRPELAGVAVTFQYLNRMVTVFLADSPLPAAVPGGMASGMMRVLGRFLRPAALSAAEPGASLGLLPEAPVPEDLRWAAGNPSIADGFARAIAAIGAAGRQAAPAGVRELVLAELAGWNGQPVGLSPAWAAEAVCGLAVADRPAGRLALLTAFAPYQVSASDIAEFRRGGATDEELIGLTSWASLAAARHAGAWLGARAPGPAGPVPAAGHP
jgi:alkylhydroperoxidase family enzyme